MSRPTEPLMVRGYVIRCFTLDELRCKCTACKRTEFTLEDVDPNLLIHLEMMRTHAGIPFIITSGARCPRHNYSVGGKRSSAHLWMPEQGEILRGVDGYFQGWGPKRSALEADKWAFNGRGWYKRPGHHYHIHVDVKQGRYARWHDVGKGIEYEFIFHQDSE